MKNDLSKELKKLWDDKDIKNWISTKQNNGLYGEKPDRENVDFLKDMVVWNTQFTHSETQEKHYVGWHPYCCSNKPCKSSAWDRMDITNYGWHCGYCNTSIGKHLHRLNTTDDLIVTNIWNTKQGRPSFKGEAI